MCKQLKVIEQYLNVVLFIMLLKVVITCLKTMDENLV